MYRRIYNNHAAEIGWKIPVKARLVLVISDDLVGGEIYFTVGRGACWYRRARYCGVHHSRHRGATPKSGYRPTDILQAALPECAIGSYLGTNDI